MLGGARNTIRPNGPVPGNDPKRPMVSFIHKYLSAVVEVWMKANKLQYMVGKGLTEVPEPPPVARLTWPCFPRSEPQRAELRDEDKPVTIEQFRAMMQADAEDELSGYAINCISYGHARLENAGVEALFAPALEVAMRPLYPLPCLHPSSRNTLCFGVEN
jgi:hypothetical protein